MSDVDARRGAVDPTRSVIVQAPAGSGKTTLLVERYLGLLAVAEAPEEILAITFTRKAAAEMRQRILRFLDPGFRTDAAHEQGALGKARAVAERVAAWGLRENPQRLLIRTIDSFNHYLARTMPVASQLGPVPTPADNTQALYRRAARRVLTLADGSDPMAEHLQRLLDWRDHRAQDIENLLAALLGKRDQWLRALGVSLPQRERLEAVLAAVVDHQLESSAEQVDAVLQSNACNPWELVELLRYAARTLAAKGRESAILAYLDGDALPQADAGDLPRWRALAELLLTGKDEVRKQVTVGQGFPPQTAEKARMQAVLEALAGDRALAGALAKARRLPEPRYGDEEWAVLDSLIQVLTRTATELEVVFASAGQTDFNGLAAAALRGLGDADNGYTDLGLYLDRRIRHILVDEFQDTNWGQLHLLEKLTAGWEGEIPPGQLALWEDEGPDAAVAERAEGRPRTLFLVGDPMQSIYRFREAEVGLFMRSRDQGVGPLMLDDRRLRTNFRARAEIVDWVNTRLGPIFPDREDVAAGAVAYAASEPGRPGGGAVEVHAYPSDTAEADAVARLIAEALAEHAGNADFRAAVIVRARSHLAHILPALARHGVAYRALQLDPLASRPVVQDLIALTRAILQPADTTALLALLRAPVCGLTLEALWKLAGDGRGLMDSDALQRLAGDDGERAARVFGALADAGNGWRRRPLRDLVEGAWQRLGGPACCTHPATDLQDAAAYLTALDQADADGLLDDWNDFEERLAVQFTAGDPPGGGAKLEILTMHGAKGLEWDLVVLPGLNRTPGGGDADLLHWLPFIAPDGDEQVLFAPLRAAEEQHNPPLIKLIRDEQRARDTFEDQRLLYVATTRARERLVLSACLDPNRDEIRPDTGTLLADLWPTTGADFVAALQQTAPDAAAAAVGARVDQQLRRVAAGWQPPRGERFAWRASMPPRETARALEFNWAGAQARRTGTVLHRLLEQVGRFGIEGLDAEQQRRLIERIPRLLRAQGTRPDQLADASAVVRDAFAATLTSDSGRWVLSNAHRDAACERPISGLVDGELVNAIVDRTFVDADGVRWIIDYKSGHHAGADLAGFLAQERERYQGQLALYRRLFEQLEGGRVKTALYLPRHARLEIVE
ncbi:MAG: UvrD-helicase domain-containing protein [Pseudomonadales bacterium]